MRSLFLASIVVVALVAVATTVAAGSWPIDTRDSDPSAGERGPAPELVPPLPDERPPDRPADAGPPAEGERGGHGSSVKEPPLPRPAKPSRAVGSPSAGRLVAGVRMPARGPSFFTWDPVKRAKPNRSWRRYGTDRTVRRVMRVLRGFRRDHPELPRVGVGDLSRPNGGGFGTRYGSIGHITHQNGLDADVYYVRKDRRERPPASPADVDRRLAQELVDRFLHAGARVIYVGPSLGLRGPPGVVVPLAYHDDHLHASFGP